MLILSKHLITDSDIGWLIFIISYIYLFIYIYTHTHTHCILYIHKHMKAVILKLNLSHLRFANCVPRVISSFFLYLIFFVKHFCVCCKNSYRMKLH